LFAEELYSSLFDSRFQESNPLQPKFVPRATSPAANTQTNTAFLAIMERYAPCLLSLLGTEKHQKVIDRKFRAERLAELCGPNITTVYLMDGHGAFTLLFLSKVKLMYGDQRLNDLNIIIVDINRTVNDYHNKFFPNSKWEDSVQGSGYYKLP